MTLSEFARCGRSLKPYLQAHRAGAAAGAADERARGAGGGSQPISISHKDWSKKCSVSCLNLSLLTIYLRRSIPYSLSGYPTGIPHVHGTRERDPKFRSTYGWHTQSHKEWTQIGSCLASSCLFRLLSCSGGVLEEGRLLAAAEEPRQQRSCQQRLPAAAGSMPRYHQLPSVDAAEVLPAPGVQQLQTKAAPAARAARSKLCCRASLRPRRRDYAARRRACRRARRAPGRSLTLRPPSPCPCPCPICCLPCRDLRTLRAPRRPPSSGWR